MDGNAANNISFSSQIQILEYDPSLNHFIASLQNCETLKIVCKNIHVKIGSLLKTIARKSRLTNIFDILSDTLHI